MRLAGVLLAVIALAQPVRAEADWLVCRVSGAAMRACCCPAKTASPTSTLARDGCCDAVHVDAAAPASTHVAAAPLSLAPVVVVASVVAGAPRGDGDARALAFGAQAQATGPPRVPIFLNVRHILG